jgi:hypothetical protein
MRPTGIVIILSIAAVGCGRVVDGTKGALNKGGEIAGSAATEVIEGVASGVQRSWGLTIEPSQDLVARGLVVGKVQVETNSAGSANTLIIYLSTDRSIQDTLHATAFDEEGREMGRSAFAVDLPAGSADFHTILFQERTDLERKSRVVIR